MTAKKPPRPKTRTTKRHQRGTHLGPCIIGIDEAGRGPVLGPMVIAAVAIPIDRLTQLEALGVDDSKKLKPEKRQALVNPIMSLACEVRIIELSPLIIDGAVIGGRGLDRLEASTSARLIREIAAGTDVQTAYVDAVGAGGVRHHQRIADDLGADAPKLVVENKADENYAVVSAASILAKVTRDQRLFGLCQAYGELGSGYPSDPKTKAAIKALVRQHLEDGEPLPDFVRCSWATIGNAVTAYREGR